MRERLGNQHFARGAVERIGKAVLVEVHQHFAQPSTDDEVGENHLGIRVVVPAVVRRELIAPHERAVARTARQHAVGPLVLAGPLFGVIGAGIAHAEVNQVELRVVRDPSPHRTAAAPPRVAGPGRRPKSGAAAERFRAYEHQGVRSHVVRGPDDLPGREVESLDPAVNAELAARWSDDHAIACDKRRHRRRLALIDIGNLRFPDLLPAPGIDGDRVSIQQVVDDLAVGVHGAAIDRVAAGNADGCGIDVGPILPFERIALVRQVEGIEHVGEGCDDVHRAADDERLPFMAAEDAGRKAPDGMELGCIRRRDL